MLTVGTESYVEVADADTYITDHYLSTDAQRIAWEAMAEGDKEIALKNAVLALENIVVKGRKKDSEQSLSFPRCYKNANYFPFAWYEQAYIEGIRMDCEVEVPVKVKNAQIHEALELASPSKDTIDFESLNSAVNSYSVTGLSESFKNVPAFASNTPETELRSKKAQKLMKLYTGGVYSVL